MTNKNKPSVERTLTFEYEDCIVIWKFNSDKVKTGPYEVEVKTKKTR